MRRFLKSQRYLMKCLGFVLLFGFISLGAIGADLFAFEPSPDDTNELKTLSTQVTSAAGLQRDEKCQAKKNLAAGKLAFCLQRAEVLWVITEGACSLATTDCYRHKDCPGDESCLKDETQYLAEFSKCREKFFARWARIENNSEGQCPDGIADPNSLFDLVATDSRQVADILGVNAKFCSQFPGCVSSAPEPCPDSSGRSGSCALQGLSCYQVGWEVNDFCCCHSSPYP
jgi:hypothetical protein